MSHELENIAQLFNNDQESDVRQLEQMLREGEVNSVRTTGTGTKDGLVLEFGDGTSAVIQAPERQRGLSINFSR